MDGKPPLEFEEVCVGVAGVDLLDGSQCSKTNDSWVTSNGRWGWCDSAKLVEKLGPTIEAGL